MKKIYCFILLTLATFGFAQTIFINELHYDNAGSDVDEGVEIAAPSATDLTGYQIIAYNGSNGAQYSTTVLSGIVPNQQSGYGTLWFAISGLQNGAPDAIALVDASSNVIQFLSYEGVLTATDGPAMGLTSTDIGVAETTSTTVGTSLQLQGTGTTYTDFTWSTTEVVATAGAINTGQIFGTSSTPSLSVTPSSLDFGSMLISSTSASQDVTVSATNLTTAPTYSISGADAAMFAASGTLTTSGGTISVTFTPSSTGTKTATLTVTDGSLTQMVTLTGSGVTAGNPYGLDDSMPLGNLVEDFETGTVGSPVSLTGWTNVAASTTDRLWDIRAYNSNQYAQFSAYNGSGAYQTLLISPAVNLDLIQKSNVSFDWNSGYSNGAELKVYLIQLNGGTMVKNLITTINDNVNTSAYGAAFTTVPLDLSTYSGNGFLAFEYVGDSNTPTTTTYQVDNVNMPALTAGVEDLGTIANQFVKNTIVDQEVMFGTASTVKVYNMMGQVVKTAKVSETKALMLPI